MSLDDLMQCFALSTMSCIINLELGNYTSRSYGVVFSTQFSSRSQLVGIFLCNYGEVFNGLLYFISWVEEAVHWSFSKSLFFCVTRFIHPLTVLCYRKSERVLLFVFSGKGVFGLSVLPHLKKFILI